MNLERAERVARAGVPYPYSSATQAREVHQRAAGRAFSRYLLWGYLVGAPGFLALFVPLAWRSGTALLVLGGGVAALVVATVAMVPLWKTIGRHRAELAAYGIATNVYGQVLPTPEEVAERRSRAAVGLDLRAEAQRALRVYRLVVGLGVLVVVAFWGVAAFAFVPVERDGSLMGWGALCAAVVGLVLAVVVSSAMRRVQAASAGKFVRRGRKSAGAVLFVVALGAGIGAAARVHVALGGPVALTGREEGQSVVFLLMLVVCSVVWVRSARGLVRRLRELGEAQAR